MVKRFVEEVVECDVDGGGRKRGVGGYDHILGCYCLQLLTFRNAV